MRLFNHIRVDAAVTPAEPSTPLQPAQAGTSLPGRVPLPAVKATNQNAAFITTIPRNGDEYTYSYGAQRRGWGLAMLSTGQTQSSRFQDQQAPMIFNVDKNHKWFEAGYPRNLGLAFKVQQKNNALQGAGGIMQPSPHQTVSIFTRRSFVGAKTLPAKPASS